MCMQTAASYARGWMVVDLLATFPVHYITDSMTSGDGVSSVNKMLRMLRMFKMFRMLRLLKLAPKLFALLETSIKLDPSLLKFLRAMMALVLMWHLMGEQVPGAVC